MVEQLGRGRAAVSEIHVCPLSRLVATRAASGAETVLTLLGPAAPPPPMPGCVKRHLRVDASDIDAARDGYLLARREDVAALLRFVEAWDRRAPLLIHCYAGVSRSTAAAFVALCALLPSQDERALAAKLRAASPTATPNPRLIAVADDLLGRRGRMIEAVRAIGRGTDCFEGNVFALFLDRN